MKKDIIYSIKSPYREDFTVKGYRFGKGEKSVAIVGSLRGNEMQQLYISSQLIKALKKLEQKGDIVFNNEILVIPSLNYYGMNIGKRFWSVDNTDINRMFPGNSDGETTQRIADGVFQTVKEYQYGIHFASFYLQGDFIPHIRMMDTGFQNPSLANLFGLQYVVIRKPQPYDTTTLNYNWQQWNTHAFSLYTNQTDRIDEESADKAVTAVLRFLSRMSIAKFKCHGGYMASTFYESDLMPVKATTAGFYTRYKHPGDNVEQGEVIAKILDPYEGEVKKKILAPANGIIFFAHSAPMIMENEIAFRMIKRFHT